MAPDEPPAEHHRLLCDALDQLIDGDLRRLVVLMPPGSAKSTYASVRFPAYFLGRKGRQSIICASYGEDLANSFGRKVRNLVGSREYQCLFPGVALSEDSRAKGEWETSAGGSYFACGVGSGVTGRRGDLGVIDDPVKGRKDADSELTRQTTWDWYKSDFITRLKPNAAQILIQCMTGDTPVLMEAGHEKPLRDIRPGDRVATCENGRITASTVRNWANNGPDSVLVIKTTSGTIVRANARHPFLVADDGEPKWIKAKDLRPGQGIFRVNGESGKARPAYGRAAKSRPNVAGTATRTTTRSVGLTAFVRHLATRILHLASVRNSSTDTGLFWKIIGGFSTNRVAYAPYVGGPQQTPAIRNTGTTCFASTIATTPGWFGAYFATIATWLSGEASFRRYLRPQPTTSDFTLDEIESISPDGVEDVFDIQVDRTENFIANGLVSHNTRWHEDDLAGRILPEDWDGDSGDFEGFDGQTWRVICLPAEARRNDPLGRKPGEYLWPDWFTAEFWEETRQAQQAEDIRNWTSLYQQTPRPEEGSFFKRDWFNRYKPGNEPERLTVYGASDYAVTEGDGDFTEHGIGGFDKNEDLWILDWWSGQESADKWIDEEIRLAKRHDPVVWAAEGGVIRRSVEPFLKKQQQSKKNWFRCEWITSNKDKSANARSFQGLASQGKVWIPLTPWGDALIDQLVSFPAGKYDDKVDVCGLFGRILHQTFAPSQVETGSKKPADPYGFDDDDEDTWKTA